MERLMRLAPSASLKEKRLTTLLGGRDPGSLRDVVEDAQILGSLELAGLHPTWDEVRASRRGEAAPGSVSAMHRALRAVEAGAAFSVAALLAWHRAVVPGGGAFRSVERGREGGPPPSPAGLIEARLTIAEEWLSAESARELAPSRVAALAMARVVEILPFDDGNGRVARLVASHLMLRAGARPPILVAGDGGRLVEALQAAFTLEMGPLATLLEEASERALDVMIQHLS